MIFMFENVVGSFNLTEIIKAIHFQSTILKRFMNLTRISLNHNKVMKDTLEGYFDRLIVLD